MPSYLKSDINTRICERSALWDFLRKSLFILEIGQQNTIFVATLKTSIFRISSHKPKAAQKLLSRQQQQKGRNISARTCSVTSCSIITSSLHPAAKGCSSALLSHRQRTKPGLFGIENPGPRHIPYNGPKGPVHPLHPFLCPVSFASLASRSTGTHELCTLFFGLPRAFRKKKFSDCRCPGCCYLFAQIVRPGAPGGSTVAGELCGPFRLKNDEWTRPKNTGTLFVVRFRHRRDVCMIVRRREGNAPVLRPPS